jgi:hypothetical protein
VIVRRFNAAGLGIQVHLGLAKLEASLDALVGTYGPPNGSIDLDYYLACQGHLDVWRNEERLRASPTAEDVLDVFALDFYRTLLRRTPSTLVLHAACVAWKEHALVLAGESGQGKSTLCHALVERGARYLSDEWTLFDDGPLASGITRPLSLELDASDTRLRAFRASRESNEVLLHPSESDIAHNPVPLHTLVILERDSNQNGLFPLNSDEKCAALAKHTLRASRGSVTILSQLVARVPTFLLKGGTVLHNTHLLEELGTQP